MTDSTDSGGPFAFWNYRIITDGTKYWVGEVYYDRGNKPEAYTDALSGSVEFDRLEDMTTTMRLVSFALDRPVLRVDKDGNIFEDLSVKAGS